MKYFIDTEFIEPVEPGEIDLISIALVADDGREYYAISSEFDPSKANEFVKDKVLPKLDPPETWKSRAVIKQELLDFVIPGDSEIEFWGEYSAYDWVVFCRIFGSMVDLPSGYPYYCNDLIQWMKQLGLGRISVPIDPAEAHSALYDARWNKKAYDWLKGKEREIIHRSKLQ
jgi:hypothetical protein